MININWDNKPTWYGLMALLLALGLAWIGFSWVSAARSQHPSSPQVDATAPDFSLKPLAGETIKLSDLRGQALVINYRVNGLPSTFFVDRQGVIRNIAIGGPMAEAFIDSQVADLLAQSGNK